MSRLDEFFHEVGEALRHNDEVQGALAKLRQELELLFERFALAHEGQQALRAQPQRAPLPLSFLRRLDEDVEVAAAWLAEQQPAVARNREEAFRLISALLSVLRVTARDVGRAGPPAAQQVVTGEA